MKSSEKFKICPSCDGKASLEVVICPYCASSFTDTYQKNKNLLSSSYSPPYSAERVTPTQSDPKNIQTAPETAPAAKETSSFLPIALLIIGSNLLILSMLLLILGRNGKVELEWSSSYWMLYLILGAPLLFLGFKIIKNDKNSSS